MAACRLSGGVAERWEKGVWVMQTGNDELRQCDGDAAVALGYEAEADAVLEALHDAHAVDSGMGSDHGRLRSTH